MLRSLAAAAAVLVLARVGWEPRIVGSDVGTTPIFNWILYGYGVPAHLVLGRRLSAAQARRRQAVAHGRSRRDPVHGADRVPRNPPLHERRRHLSPRPARSANSRCRSAPGLRWRSGSSTCATAPTASCTTSARCVIAALTFAGIVLGLWLIRNPLFTGEPVGGAVHQPHPARLRHSGGARHRAGDADPRRPPAGLSHLRRGHRGAADAELPLARGAHALSTGRCSSRGVDQRCRAIHLFGGVARLWRGAAAVRHRVPLAAGAARFRRGHAAHGRQGVPASTWRA